MPGLIAMSSAASTPTSTVAIAQARLNVRRGAPSTSAPIAMRLDAGATLPVTGSTTGERVHGNAVWLRTQGDLFVWSGAVTLAADEGRDVSAMPLRRRPDGTVRPLGEAEIRTLYGDFDYEEGAGGRISIDPAWVDRNLRRISLPALARIGHEAITVHRAAVAAFSEAFDAIAAAGLADRLLTFSGTWVARHKGWDPERSLSSHSWGIAIDLNVAWNGYGAVPAPVGARGSLRELVEIFASCGFAWGGHFKPQSICDGMHFELAVLRVDGPSA